MPVRKDINFNAGFTGCEDRMNILKNATVPRNLSEFTELEPAEIDTNMYVYVDHAGKGEKIKLGNIIDTSATQADWDEKDEYSYSYIKNKPDLVFNEDFVSLYNIGGVSSGQVFPAGTSIIEVLKEILSVSGDVVFRFGIIDADDYGALPGDFSVYQLQEYDNNKLADILQKGWSPNNGNPITLESGRTGNGQFFILAIPKSERITLEKCYQAGYALGLAKVSIDEEWDGWFNADDLYLFDRDLKLNDDKLIEDTNGIIYQLAPTVGSFIVDYRFRLK